MARRRRLRRAARGAGRVRAVSRCTGEDGGGGRGPTTPDARRTRRDETEKKCLQYEETKRVFFTRTRARARLTGTRSHAPTATPPGGLQPPRPNTSTRSTGTRLRRAHRNTSRWPPPAALQHVFSSHRTRSRAPTATPPGGLSPPPPRTSPSPTGTRSGAPTATPPGGLPSPPNRTLCSSHGHPFARAHFNTSRWPPSAAYVHVNSFHGHPFSRAH